MTDPAKLSEFTENSLLQKAIRMVASGGIAFTPSSYGADLVMDGTAQSGELAAGTLKVQVVNLGVTTEAIRFAFGTSALDAKSNLNHSTDHATTGYYMPANAEGGSKSLAELGVPSNATHYAVENATAADTQTVIVNFGV